MSYQLAFVAAVDESVVSVFSSLAPLVIVTLRTLGLLPTFPTRLEIGGTALGLSGAALCAATATPADADAGPGVRRLLALEKNGSLALALGLVCALAHAAYACMTRDARRGGVSAPALHLCMQAGAAVLSAAACAWGGARPPSSVDALLSLDGTRGLLGFLAPENRVRYLWMGVGVDTFGTFGYTVAATLVDPLLITCAALTQPVFVVLEGALALGRALPPATYVPGAAALVFGGAIVSLGGTKTEQDLVIDKALGKQLPPSRAPDREEPDAIATLKRPSMDRIRWWRARGSGASREEATSLV